MVSAGTLTFKVNRRSPELIPPAKPTPHELKPLSDIDDQQGLRFQIRTIQFYRRSAAMAGRDPVAVIRRALATALVFYYPFAGRLREGAARKLVVECTGEGVLFIEADADVELRQFGASVQPPFPCLEELLHDVAGSDGIIGCPLLLIQVTRLKCGGFIFALRLNHTMSDAAGLAQFMAAVADISRGADAPSILPVWQRHLLNARNPPCVSHAHRAYDHAPPRTTTIPAENMVHRSFFFGAAEISALRRRLPPRLHNSSTFAILAACLWRCRTTAISPAAGDEVRLLCIVNARRRFNPPLPAGYYGNAIAYPVATAAAGKLSENPFQYAVDLVRRTTAAVTEEYMKSLPDFMVMNRRPGFMMDRSYLISDLRAAGFREVDFGWGKPEYGGPARGCTATSTYFLPFTNEGGENGILVPVCLGVNAMEVFAEELQKLLRNTVSSSL
ncbi:benzyl alcohol O-benzoyltransferase-like [Andrographis paniculata]|uniref:benzyl alcohol O-benzoyltransferase-like n=1 Tax=Andrographis paniculata TaxID=175694 RepID=UPI0021E848EB|nr:benzyl alcohol O-benzoyltransferase-like [Andrographis paniculata]